MHIFFTDEAKASDISGGKRPEKADRFIYGGIIIPEPSLKDVNMFLHHLKEEFEIPQEVELKWGFANFLEIWQRFPNIDESRRNLSKARNPQLYNSLRDRYNKLKEEIFNFISTRQEIKIVFALRPIKLLKTQKPQALKFSLANIGEKFEKFLNKINDIGIIAADNFLNSKVDRKQEHSNLIKLLYQGSGRLKFDKIVWIIPNVISELSPAHQINDVILGCFCYYIYAYTKKLDGEPSTLDIARPLLAKIIDNFLVSKPNRFGGRLVLGSGILVHPPRSTRSPDTWTGQFLDGLEYQLREDFSIP